MLILNTHKLGFISDGTMTRREICRRKPFIFVCLLIAATTGYLVFHMSGWSTVQLRHAFMQLNPYTIGANSTNSTPCPGNRSSCVEASSHINQGSPASGVLSSGSVAFHISQLVLEVNNGTVSPVSDSRQLHEDTTETSGLWNTSQTVDVGKTALEDLANSTSCSSSPKNTTGQILISTEPVTPDQILASYPYILPGGRVKPQTCVSDQKVAIIIPYRDRGHHLHVLLNNLIPLLQRQLVDAVIFVVEQAHPTIFNRGSLFNIGFLESRKVDQFDCFIFHDVDMIPTHDGCVYTCGDNPRHFISSVNFKGLPYERYFGGVVGMTREQYQSINGHSNLFFGWGGEDDDLYLRCQNKGYKHVRYPVVIGQYYSFKHDRDKGNEAFPDRFKLFRTTQMRQDVDGLNSVAYRLEKLEYRPLYTWIYVSVDIRQIVRTAPTYMKDDIVHLFHHI